MRKFTKGQRIKWTHLNKRGKKIISVGEYERLINHPKAYHGEQKAYIFLDDKFSPSFAPLSELTLEGRRGA